jgi:membrane carboxypeptidase/penicillin-binding protein
MKLFARNPGQPKRNRLWRWGWKISLLGIVFGGALSVFLFYWGWAQTFDMKKVGQMPERNTVLDVDGKIYSRLAGANRLIVSLNGGSPRFIDALLAREVTRLVQRIGSDR